MCVVVGTVLIASHKVLLTSYSKMLKMIDYFPKVSSGPCSVQVWSHLDKRTSEECLDPAVNGITILIPLPCL